VISLIIVAVVVFGTWQLFKDSLHLALDGVPNNIELKAVETYLREIEGVIAIHDLHIWAMSTTEIALTVHLVMCEDTIKDQFLNQTAQQLKEKFGIPHATIQIETENPLYPCCLDDLQQI
jgi:cobalt-zinc-cadmium efflux system protein